MIVAFTIPGRLRGKGRPRFSTKGGQVRTFTDAKTEAAEGVVRGYAAQAMNGRPPIEGPVALSIAIWQAIPPSWSKKKRSNAFYLTGRPDCDNSLKLAADSLRHIVYHDDAQISDASVTRRYAENGMERVEIKITALLGVAA